MSKIEVPENIYKDPMMVIIRWIDSTSQRGWVEYKSKAYKPPRAECLSIGYLIHETDDWYAVAQNMSTSLEPEEDEAPWVSVSDVISILKSSVISVTKLNEEKCNVE